MARNTRSNTDENKSQDAEIGINDGAKVLDDPNRPSDSALNGAERQELGHTVDTETGKVIETDSLTKEGQRAGGAAPGTDPSTEERIMVRAKERTLFHDPFQGISVDDSDDGGNPDGVVKTAMVASALDDGRLIEV